MSAIANARNRPGRGEWTVGPTAVAETPRWSADDAVTALYTSQYRSLVRISSLLLHDVGAAEEVVQDAFVALHGRWWRLRDPDKALAYLRQSVVNRSRSALRHRGVAERHAPAPPGDAASAEDSAMASVQREEILTALRLLPGRQREVLVLRYYADLSEAQIAQTLKISNGAVKSHASRGVASMRTHLEQLS